MKAEVAFNFLAPSIAQMNDFEREKLSNLILGRESKKGLPATKIITKTEIRKKLMNGHFKSRIYRK